MAPTTVSRGGLGNSRHIRPGAVGGKGKLVHGPRRHRKTRRDTIKGITKPDIRRLARRGGVKRISAGIYDEVRGALRDRLSTIIQDCVIYTDYRNRKTVTVSDVIHALRRIGRPIYGFDPETYVPNSQTK